MSEEHEGETTMSENVTETVTASYKATNEIVFQCGGKTVTMRMEDGNLVFLCDCGLDDAARVFLQAVSAMAMEEGYGFGKVKG